MVTALTASAKAKGLFKQAWVTNGAGVIPDQSLSQANKDNKVKIILIILAVFTTCQVDDNLDILKSISNCANLQKILQMLNCGSDEVECLVDKVEVDLLNAVPADWLNTKMAKLPRKNPIEDKGHSWIIIDKNILMKSPIEFWKENKGSNIVPIVVGK